MRYKMQKKSDLKIWIMRLVIMILMVLWMSVIFGFSSEEGEQSQSLSDKITIRVVHLVKPNYDNLTLKEQKLIFNKVSFVVRKTGHFGEYAILGLLFATFLITFEKIRNAKPMTVVLTATGSWCMIYAITDEIHQGFVDGRSPKVMDVGIDTAGGLSGAVFLLLMFLICKRIKKSLPGNMKGTI